MTEQLAPLHDMEAIRTIIARGGGAWPPASPYVWSASWWEGNTPYAIILSIRFDSPVNGGGTNALQGVDYDLDPKCPWEYLIVVRANGTRLSAHIPRGARTGTITSTQLHNFGLDLFTDIGSITVGTSPN